MNTKPVKPIDSKKEKELNRLVRFGRKEERESVRGIVEYYISTLDDSAPERLTKYYLNLVIKTLGYPQKAVEQKPIPAYDGRMKMSRREKDIRDKYTRLSESYDRLVRERNELGDQLENLQFLFEKLSAKKTQDILEIIHRRSKRTEKNTV